MNRACSGKPNDPPGKPAGFGRLSRPASYAEPRIAANMIAAVSTRRMRGPRSTVCQPAATANATSSSVNPPSGPIAAIVAGVSLVGWALPTITPSRMVGHAHPTCSRGA
jgi:hypothetical protein